MYLTRRWVCVSIGTAPGDGTGVRMTAQGVGGLEWGLVGTVGPRGKLRMGRQFLKRQPFARAIQLHYRFSLSL